MMKRFAIAALAVCALAWAKPSAATTLTFDPDGTGGASPFTASVFDWLPGNSMIVEHTNPDGSPTGLATIYFQANLGTITGSKTFLNGSAGDGSWFTAVAKFDVAVVQVDPVGDPDNTKSFVLPGGSLRIYADNERGNNLTGLGFAADTDAVEVLYAVVGGGEGNLDFNAAAPTPLDGYTDPELDANVPEPGGQNYATLTKSGQGSTNLFAVVETVNTDYFKDLVIGTALVLTNSSQIDPFNQANPSGQFSTDTINDGGECGVPCVGPVNGLGNRIVAQSDANSSFATVPEPASMTLLGLGLAGMAARRRQKKAQQQA